MGEAKSPDRVANDAALLEYYFKSLDNESGGRPLVIGQKYPELYGWEILDDFPFDRSENGKCTKAFVVKDPDGNLYVHFKGTDDGDWKYNAVAYGPQNGKVTSDLQDQALNWFDKIVRENYDFDGEHKLYVTGHSQGGNNAQFVTLRSQYGDLVDTCVSLDGPNFSDESVEQTKELIGEDAYSHRTDKIYGYYGEYDYVSCLGEESVISDDHIKYIDYDESRGVDYGAFHVAAGLFYNEDGPLKFGWKQDEPSVFRKVILACNEKIKQLPESQKEEFASAVMKICENLMGKEIKVDLSEEELDLVIELIAPALLETMQENPEEVKEFCKTFSLPIFRPIVGGIYNYVDGALDVYATLSDEDKQKINNLLEAAFSTENGFDYHELMNAIIRDPDAVEVLLRSPEVDIVAAVVAGISFIAVSIVVKSIILATLADPIAAILSAITCLMAVAFNFKEILSDAMNILETIAAFCAVLCDLVIDLGNTVVSFFKDMIGGGSKYALNNPYIKIDTTRMDSYAARLRRVNQRLIQLDRDMNDLYWQVGFLDLADILAANLITCESRGISKVIDYLTETADDFNRVENKVRQMFGR